MKFFYKGWKADDNHIENGISTLDFIECGKEGGSIVMNDDVAMIVTLKNDVLSRDYVDDGSTTLLPKSRLGYLVVDVSVGPPNV